MNNTCSLQGANGTLTRQINCESRTSTNSSSRSITYSNPVELSFDDEEEDGVKKKPTSSAGKRCRDDDEQ